MSLWILFHCPSLSPSGAETSIIQANWIITKAADALAPCVTKASAAMILTMNDKQILVFSKKCF